MNSLKEIFQSVFSPLQNKIDKYVNKRKARTN